MEIDFTNLTSEIITDFHCLETFCSGVEAMDKFIQGDFRLSVENHYCSAYGVWYKEELIAIYALSFDSLDLDVDDKDELESGMSLTGTPNIDLNYRETFYAKPRYPALDIAYLAVREEYRGYGVGQSIIEMIAERARVQSFAGCQFLLGGVLFLPLERNVFPSKGILCFRTAYICSRRANSSSCTSYSSFRTGNIKFS